MVVLKAEFVTVYCGTEYFGEDAEIITRVVYRNKLNWLGTDCNTSYREFWL